MEEEREVSFFDGTENTFSEQTKSNIKMVDT